MKPITHPLAIAYVEACASDEYSAPHLDAWAAAGFPLYADAAPLPAHPDDTEFPPELFEALRRNGYPVDDVCKPTPLPAPALGMRVWYEVRSSQEHIRTQAQDVNPWREGATWADYLAYDPACVALITDYRTGEVLWRRA